MKPHPLLRPLIIRFFPLFGCEPFKSAIPDMDTNIKKDFDISKELQYKTGAGLEPASE